MENSAEALVSIITPTYNASKYVLETIHSVRSQTYQNWEMIIVDDASTDDTVEIVSMEIEIDPRIKLIKLEENSGPAHARNTAISFANGAYLAFLDSDDLWIPEKLEKQLDFMERNKIAFSFTDYRLMKENGKKTDIAFCGPNNLDYNTLLKNTIIGTLTVMINKEMVEEIKMPLDRDCSEDYGLWLQILSTGIVAHGLNEELAYYRKCENSLSSNKFKSAIKTWNTYRKVRKINIPHSLWYFTNYSINALRKHTKTV